MLNNLNYVREMISPAFLHLHSEKAGMLQIKIEVYEYTRVRLVYVKHIDILASNVNKWIKNKKKKKKKKRERVSQRRHFGLIRYLSAWRKS